MWQTLAHLLSAAWQVHLATLGLIVAGKSFYEALGIALIGSTIGVSLVFFSIDLLGLLYRGFVFLINKITSRQTLTAKPANQSAKPRRLAKWHQQAVKWMAGHRYPKAIIFLVIALPMPGTEYLAIMASRYTKMSYSFYVIFTANAIRTFLIVLLEYYISGRL